MYRYTIRDLLWLTVFVAVACAGLANSRQVAAVAERWGLAICKEAVKIGPPLMGRGSVEPEW